MAKESALKPFYSVLVLAFGCSLLVAGAAVGLRPLQESNRQLDQKKNILRAAGIYTKGASVEEQFKMVTTRLVELESGRFVPEDEISLGDFNQLKAAFSDELGRKLLPDEDLARLARVERYSLVYLIGEDPQVFDQVVLPVRGKGLWSTMYAYVSLDADLNTIEGISFYAHGETPGLGGEIDNANWQKGWQGKKIYNQDLDVQLEVVKGSAAKEGDTAPYQIDGLSGATMTSVG